MTAIRVEHHFAGGDDDVDSDKLRMNRRGKELQRGQLTDPFRCEQANQLGCSSIVWDNIVPKHTILPSEVSKKLGKGTYLALDFSLILPTISLFSSLNL